VKEQQFRLYDDSYAIAEDLLTMSRERHELGLLSDWSLTQRMLEDVVARLARDRRIIALFNSYNTLLVTVGLDYGQWEDNLLEMEADMPADTEDSGDGENIPSEDDQLGDDESDYLENMMAGVLC